MATTTASPRRRTDPSLVVTSSSTPLPCTDTSATSPASMASWPLSIAACSASATVGGMRWRRISHCRKSFSLEPPLVLPTQGPPQPRSAWPQRVDHLPPVATGFACVREISGQRGAHLLKRDIRGERVDVGQLGRRAGGTESARQRAVTRQQGHGGTARDERQRDVDAGESRTDHHTLAGRRAPKAASAPGAHGSTTTCRRRLNASAGAKARSTARACRLGAPGREHDGVGGQGASVGQRQAHGRARCQPDNLGSFDPHVGDSELFFR